MNAGKLGLLTVGLMVSLTACGLLGGSGPKISSFSANPSTIMSGESSELSWELADTATSISISGGVGDVTGDADNRVTVTPTTTTTYTLTAKNAEGMSTDTTVVTVSGGNGGGSGGDDGTNTGDPASAPEGTFGVSTSATGTFFNDAGEEGLINSDSDPRIITVTAGSTFYAQVEYSDPDGIEKVSIFLANSSPEGLRGALPNDSFSVGEPTGDCAVGTGATAVTCVYPITVAPGTLDISELAGAGSEFAYVFRATVMDGASNTITGQERGYVNIN